jgi:hypothetical protein
VILSELNHALVDVIAQEISLLSCNEIYLLGMALGRARKRLERCRGLIAIWVACSGYGGSNGVLMAFMACFQLWVKTPVTVKEGNNNNDQPDWVKRYKVVIYKLVFE